MSYLRDWNSYNEALVKRGLILLDLDFVASWSREPKAMNESKEGGKIPLPRILHQAISGRAYLCFALQATGRLHARFKPVC